jgi:farnesyl-diphosphate farnesyltransferase
LRQILKKVSRSFYVSLIILPRCVREPVSLAYLFCRAADTIADTRLLPAGERQQALDVFRQQFLLDVPAFDELEGLSDKLMPYQGGEGERQLLHHVADCFRLFLHLSVPDQQLLRELVGTLTQGMEMDLTQFPAETAEGVRALPHLEALDLYTYYVAGVVGEFWTKIHAAHIPALQGRDLPALCDLGIRFGKGLQMTNVLKDLGRDLHHGRCYVPQTCLRAFQLNVQELLRPETLEKLRPLLDALTWYTLDHLDGARHYILSLPRRTIRLRLSCMWPLLFALQTLAVIRRSELVLQPQARIKISRLAVYRTMLCSLACLVSPRVFTWYYARLRQRLTALLGAYIPLTTRVHSEGCG